MRCIAGAAASVGRRTKPLQMISRAVALPVYVVATTTWGMFTKNELSEMHQAGPLTGHAMPHFVMAQQFRRGV
jgi:hypothetical protein